MISTSEEKELPGVSILRKLVRRFSKERRWRAYLDRSVLQRETNYKEQDNASHGNDQGDEKL
jgi:hypothetical protein